MAGLGCGLCRGRGGGGGMASLEGGIHRSISVTLNRMSFVTGNLMLSHTAEMCSSIFRIYFSESCILLTDKMPFKRYSKIIIICGKLILLILEFNTNALENDPRKFLILLNP